MFQLLQSIGSHQLFLRQLPLLIVSFGIASLFYKFGSFALECLAFLATWFLLDVLVQGIMLFSSTLRGSRSPR